MYAGMVAVPVEERALRDSAATLMEATGAKAIWTEEGLGESGAPKGFSKILQGDLWNEAAGENPPAAREASDGAVWMATYGSTRVPRFVIVSHRDLIANTQAIGRG